MPRAVLILALAGLLAVGSAGQAAAASSVTRPAVNAAPSRPGAGPPRPVLVAFRGGFHFGGYRRGRYGYGVGGYGRGRPRSSVLHRVVKTAIWLYVLHLFFSHGGVSVLLWIVIIGLVLAMLRRRRRFTYAQQSPWS